MSPSRDWNARSYDRVSAPMEALGREVVARMDLRGDETVLDAGCGTGRVTEALLARLPRGRVIGIDGSPAMIESARERLGDFPGSLEVQDLTELTLDEPVDAILSTATFHWVADHDTLFARLRAVLRDRGALEAQCGGFGNVTAVHAAAAEVAARPDYAAAFAGWEGPWNFQTPEATEERLRRSGFATARCWLEPRPVVPEEPHEYLATIVLGAHLERLAPEAGDAFVAEVVEALGAPVTVDYVRLNISAVG